MSTIVEVNGKTYAFLKGASEYVVKTSTHFRDLETGEIVPKDYKFEQDVNQAITHMAEKALRTIGLAYKEVNFEEIDIENSNKRGVFEYEETGWIMIGICGIKDIIRPEVPDSIKKCNMAGI